MSQLHAKLLRHANRILASLIALLGFSGCHQGRNITAASATDNLPKPQQDTPQVTVETKTSWDDEIQPVKYGVPLIRHTVHGRVCDASGRPIRNIRIAFSHAELQHLNTQTDEKGMFHLTYDALLNGDNRLIFTDESGKYRQRVILLPQAGEETDGTWNSDGTQLELNIVMQPARMEREIRVMYGLPPSMR